MKKIISLFLVSVMALMLFSCGGNKENQTTDMTNNTSSSTSTPSQTTSSLSVPIVSEGFDEKNIVLQFGSVSDIHTSTNPDKVQHAFEVLKNTAALYTEKGISAVFVDGDLTNDYGSDQNIKAGEITQVKNVYEKVFNPSDVPMIYVLGNHDHDFKRNGGAGSDLQTFINVMGNVAAYTQYDVETSDKNNGSRHVVINGYHFLMVEPITYSCEAGDINGAFYFDETKQWLDSTLAEITNENPNQYVFVLTHPMIYGTVYGSDLVLSTTLWYTKDLTSILDKYPQVVTFGGHLHFPLNDERSIMQKTFTSLGCGSVQYMAIENGSYENMSSQTVMNDSYSVSSGYLVQIDASGNVRFIRIDFQNNASIKTPFVISAPKADGSHLKKYTSDRGNSENNQAPYFPENALVLDENSNTDSETLNVTLKFKSAIDDDLIHDYSVKVTRNGAVVARYNILSDFYRHAQTEDMKDEWTLDFDNSIFSRGEKYVISVTAKDSWGASTVAELIYEPVLDTSNVKLPDVYADLDFSNGKITDINNKLTIENVGATIADTSLTFAGVTKTVPAFNVTAAGQYAKLTFADLSSSSAFSSMFKNDFSIEVLYVNRSKSGTVGIVSGYDKYGFGFFEEEGSPAFKISLRGDFPTVTAASASSTSELVHVTAVYSKSSTYIYVYVNGVAKSNQVAGIFRAKDANFNVLCLGANATDTGVSDNATDLSVVDVKFYADKITPAQAVALYEKAVENFKNQ